MKTTLLPFVLPPLGAQPGGKATVLRWIFQPGSAVAKDSEIIEVEAEKCAFGVESPVSGVLESLLKVPGDEVMEGESLGMIRVGS